MLDNPDESDCVKHLLVLRWFYDDSVPADGVNGFIQFLAESGGKNSAERSDGKRYFDFDFDAGEIYASFLAEYRIDLFDVDFLHWYKFRALLQGLSPESAFCRKIAVRFRDTSNLKGRDRTEAEAAKETVQLPPRRTDSRETGFDSKWDRAAIGG
jgi:hypothetical protein